MLAAAILGMSVSGPLARLSAAHPLAIASWRLIITLGVVAVFLTASRGWAEYRTLARRDLAIALFAGAVLAVHFWVWIASLALTSVSASIVLVNLHPVVIVAGSALFLHERPNARQLAGIAVAMLGALLVAWGDRGTGAGGPFAASGRALVGDGLAFLGGVTVGVYYLVGRSLRQRLSIWPYAGLVYSAALVVLLLLAALNDVTLWPQPPREWPLFFGIAVGPMLLGHTGFNWALRYVPAYVVSLAILAEPVGATLLAAVLPGIREIPGVWTLVGGAIVLTGLALGTIQPRRAGV
ncbi:MAG: DMT family transporter [Gemmatimonadota bacterium]|nr:DMT family transporter [Gemmatimonadota bacterium]